MADKAVAASPAAGRLVVSDVNPRYFTVRSGRAAVYLTGSHLNNNFHDGMGPGADCPEVPEESDFGAYLDFLVDHGHNFIRLWRWELVKSQVGGGNFHACMTPQPWSRSGPGMARDGKPKFDLSAFDEAYFRRLRHRVAAAGERGIYTSVMLFEGFSLHLTPPPDNVEGHPFHAANNVNGISITSIVDYQVLPLHPDIQALQEAYLRRVVDTVHDLPNVLYEVANESSGDTADSVRLPDGSVIETPIGDTTQWQYWVIDYVKRYERQRGYDAHPVGMTMQYPVPDQTKVNEPLFRSPADWISPGFDDTPMPSNSRWLTDPPAGDGAKVIISDTDHYSPFRSDAPWAWKSFLRGLHPILYDFGIFNLREPLDPSVGLPPYEAYEPARHAMGDTLRYARRVNLIEMEPRGELSSTGYALANPGEEYLVLQPGGAGDPFTVAVAAGSYAAEWYSVTSRETVEAGTLAVGSESPVSFRAPFETPGPAVLYLRRVS
ncbi:MAG TPA: hypothetical protein VGJ95_05415 [Pseudonocardiaceae bacterium]|jgi:hypothetical protein